MDDNNIELQLEQSFNMLREEVIAAVRSGEDLRNKIFYIAVVNGHVDEKKVQIQLRAVFDKKNSLPSNKVTRKDG
jgi:hypothetical protein